MAEENVISIFQLVLDTGMVNIRVTVKPPAQALEIEATLAQEFGEIVGAAEVVVVVGLVVVVGGVVVVVAAVVVVVAAVVVVAKSVKSWKKSRDM